MSRRRVVVRLTAGFLLAASPLPVRASSSPATTSDPRDSTGSLDVKEVVHADSADTITYEVEFYAPVEPSKYSAVDWFIDFDRDPNKLPDMCVNTVFDQGRGTVVGEVTGANCAHKVADATVARIAPARYRVSFPRSAMSGAGLRGNDYGYDVESFDFAAGQGDLVPDSDNFGITHALGPGRPGATRAPLPSLLPPEGPVRPGAGGADVSGHISRPALRAGQSALISGGGFQPGTELEITLRPENAALGTTTADGAGRFSATVRIPTATPPGEHTVEVSGPAQAGGLHVTRIAFVVIGSSPAGAAASPRASDPVRSSGANRVAVAVVVAVLVGLVALAARSSSLRARYSRS